MGSSGDDEAILLDKYHFVALWVAGRYSSQRSLATEWDDVLSDASIGVLDAIRHLDPTQSALAQKSYVFARARGTAIDGIRYRSYGTRSGRWREPTSLDMFRATLGDAWEPSMAEGGYAEVDAAETVSLLLVQLSSRRRFVIEALYFAGRSMADIGRELGVSESMISRIHTAALRQMRAMSAEEDP